MEKLIVLKIDNMQFLVKLDYEKVNAYDKIIVQNSKEHKER